jgi:hydroxymethylglutaryl-CoA synthase
MRGILSIAGYVPHHRLRRSAITDVLGGARSGGARAVASYDEDATTMAVAAGRLTLQSTSVRPAALWFATTTPPYLDKTNATTIHAALRLERNVVAADFGGAPRSAMGAFLAALRSSDPVLVAAADIRTGLPGSGDERDHGDGAAAVLVGDEEDGAPIAAVLGAASVSEEFLDRWREPGDVRSKVWEERFGETRYVPLAAEAAKRCLEAAGLTDDDVDVAIVTGLHGRAVKQAGRALGVADLADERTDSVGITGAAHPLLLLAGTLEQAAPGRTILLLSLADGADAVLLRTTEAIADWQPPRPVAAQIAAGDDTLRYADYLAWRGILTPEPPRRPEPNRVSASAAARSTDWKYGFVGSRDRTSDAVHLPPSRVSFRGGARDDMDPAPMADVPATVTTFTVDRLAWSPSPPTVFAVLDFDGGGRFACEITDVAPEAVAIGDRVEMTFRCLNTADGIRNYFWKARPMPAEAAAPPAAPADTTTEDA